VRDRGRIPGEEKKKGGGAKEKNDAVPLMPVLRYHGDVLE